MSHNKLLRLFVCLLLVLSNVSPLVYAAEGELRSLAQLSLEEFITTVMPLVKDKAEVPNSYSEFYIHPITDWQSEEVTGYYLTWSKPRPTNGYSYSDTIGVYCDLSGRINNYQASYYDYTYYSYSPQSEGNRQQMEKIAYAFACRLYPEIAAELSAISHNDRPRSVSYSNEYYFPRLKNGIRVANQGVRVYIDSYSRINSLYYDWDQEAVFPEALPERSAKELRAALKPYFNLKLAYTITPRYNLSTYWLPSSVEVSEPFLIYKPQYSGYSVVLSAADLSPHSISPSYSELSNKGNLHYLLNQLEYLYETPTPASGDLLSIEDITARLAQNHLLFLPENLNPDYSNFMRDARGRLFLELNLRSGEYPQDYSGAQLRVDIENGAIHKYNYYYGVYSYEEDASYKPLDRNLLRQKAEEYLSTYWPEYLATSRFLETPELALPETIYTSPLAVAEVSFTWVRTLNGLDFEDNFLRISVDARSGKITALDKLWDDDLVPPPARVALTLEQAEDIFWEKFSPELVYYLDYETHQAYPVYQSDIYDMMTLDAADGRLRYGNGSLYLPYGEQVFSDLQGYAEQELLELAFRSGFLPWESSSFQPENLIAQETFVYSVARLTPNSSYSVGSRKSAYDHLQQLGALTPQAIAQESSLTGGEALEIFLKAMDYGAVAEMEDLFNPIPGIASYMQGYVAVGRGLEIIDADFAPDEPLTNLQAALMIARYLVRHYR